MRHLVRIDHPLWRNFDRGNELTSGIGVRPGRKVRCWHRIPATNPPAPPMADNVLPGNAILIGKSVTSPDSLPETHGQVFLQGRLGNRHGLVAGATGTGKTVTLMTIAEGFSRMGVPVFLADVKGDV